jgi:hypothetical protein
LLCREPVWVYPLENNKRSDKMQLETCFLLSFEGIGQPKNRKINHFSPFVVELQLTESI